MSVRWINQFLGTASAIDARREADVVLLDVRDLVDKTGNPAMLVEEKLTTGLAALKAGNRLVVFCDYGISRSNAVAAGLIALMGNNSVDAAALEIIAATGESEIKLELLAAVRSVVEASQVVPASDGLRPDRILVTGAAGFLGTALVGRLNTMEVQVVAPSRPQLDLLRDRAKLDILIRDQRITCLVHLANPSVYTSNLALGDTLGMLRNILEACVANQVFLVYPSGWEVYSGYRTLHLTADESLPPFPAGPYGDTKFLGEVLINHFRRRSDLECALLRFSPVYGPGSGRPKFIHTFIEKAKNGARIKTHRYMNGAPCLDLLHIEDATDALAKAVSTRYSGDLNIGTGRLTTTREIAEWIVQWMQSDSIVETVDIHADVACIAMDSRRALQKIGWQPSVDVQSGLHDVVRRVMSPQSIKRGDL